MATSVDVAEVAERAAGTGAGSRLLERLAELVGGRAAVNVVFGEPVRHDEITVIPVARVRWGFGGGGGAGLEGSGSGGGGGAAADAIGYIEMRSEGATFRRLPGSLGPATLIAGAIATAIVLRALSRARR